MVVNDDYTISGTHQVTIPQASSNLKFTHPSMAQPLVVTSGANAIQWAYTLNTAVSPTIGGEVIQLLSAYVGPMTIQGITVDRNELNTIKEWFLEYMERAGTSYKGYEFRNEQAVQFTYAARGWSFYIAPTQFQGFTYDKTVYAMPWSIQAEIVSDNALNYFSGVSMTAFTGVLSNPAFIDIGYSDPTGTGKASYFVNPTLSANIPQLAATMGDNFKRLVATADSGDFANFAFGSLSNQSALPPSVQSTYNQLFGDTTSSTSDGTPTSGTYTYPNSTGGTSQADVVNEINTIFEGNGLPGDLGVAVAMVESGLNPDSRQKDGDFAMGLFQTFPSGRGGSTAHATEVTQAFDNQTKSVTLYYPATDQIADAAQWFKGYVHDVGSISDSSTDQVKGQLAIYAQGHTGDADGGAAYAAKVINNLASARALISQYNAQGTANGSFISYNQGDSRWANHHIYTANNDGTDTIGADGCGPTSAAMTIASLKNGSVTPVTTGDYLTNLGSGVGYTSDGATTSGLTSAVQSYGLQAQSLGTDFSLATAIINKGGYVIAGGEGASPFSPAGHVVVLRAVTSNGGFLIGNPAPNLQNSPDETFSAASLSPNTLYMIGVTNGS